MFTLGSKAFKEIITDALAFEKSIEIQPFYQYYIITWKWHRPDDARNL